MVACPKCRLEGLYYHYYELKQTYILFDGTEKPHVCAANPFDVQKSVDDFSIKYRSKILKDMPIYCNICECHYKPTSVCGHILKLGFIEGIDTVEYFSSRYDMIELRKQRVKAIKDKLEAIKKFRIGYAKDLTEYTK